MMADQDLALAVKHMAQHIAERSNAPGPAAPSGEVQLRMAAIKGMERGRTSEGNREANALGHAPSNEKRKGNVKPAARAKPEENKTAKEPKPSFAGEPWAEARQKALVRHRKAK